MTTASKTAPATIEKTLDLVTESARTHQNPECRHVHTDKDWPVGKFIRQGDVYIKRLPLDAIKTMTGLTASAKTMQIATGDTVGSRHIVSGLGKGRILNRENATVLQGPIIEAPTGFYLGHPTHGDFDATGLPGCYEVSFPRDLTQENLARLRD